MMSLQLDTRAHCDVNSVQGAGGTRTLSNSGTWRSSATLLAARHRVGILSDSRSSVVFRRAGRILEMNRRECPVDEVARVGSAPARHMQRSKPYLDSVQLEPCRVMPMGAAD